ncbi:NADH dehydrogenase complex I [Diplonema papillatum]|nr:NADH dehydrogenase complex I [Diplonema papillatum]
MRRCLPRLCRPQNVRTPLGDLLAAEINKTGPIPFARFMDEAMRHPELGYFTTKTKVIGTDADFITAPELLPEFGYCIARWLCLGYEKVTGASGVSEGDADLSNAPPFTLIEVGPGTGRLMYQVLAYLKYGIGESFLRKVHLRMVEVSPVMRRQQEAILKDYLPLLGSAQWSDTVNGAVKSRLADNDTLPGSFPTFVMSNEYFDVLPVHVLRRVPAPGGGGKWVEELVGCRSAGDGEAAEFEFAPASEHDDESKFVKELLITEELREGEVGDRREVSPEAIDAFLEMASIVDRTGGMILAIDYGRDAPSAHTIQGMHKQVQCSPLLSPGMIDISWHVDFAMARDHVISAFNSLHMTSAVPQHEFLRALGIDGFIKQRRQQGILPDQLQKRYDMLMSPSGMGGWHRAVAICKKELYPPPGF